MKAELVPEVPFEVPVPDAAAEPPQKVDHDVEHHRRSMGLHGITATSRRGAAPGRSHRLAMGG
jgi:hypothetical protein